MPVKGGGRKRPAAQQPKQMKSQQQQTKRQKKPEPDFHYVKLQNAFLAHQVQVLFLNQFFLSNSKSLVALTGGT